MLPRFLTKLMEMNPFYDPILGWGSSTNRSLPSGSTNSLFQRMSASTTIHHGSHHHRPTKILNEKIRDRDWDACRLRVLYYASDALFISKKMNNATPLHLACLYRAPFDVVQLILNANPQALFCQDSEGWTPLHVALLYSSDDNLSLMLIRRGGPAAVSIQSKVVGTPLHFAMRHNCSTAVIAELLRTNPSMATTANEYSTKPARILWHQYARNPDNERLLQEILDNNYQQSLPHQGNHHHQSITELTDRLALLLQTVNDKQRTRDNHQDIDRIMIVHHVVEATEETLGDLSQYVPVVVLLYPTSVQSRDEHGNLPLHKAAANRTSCSATSQNCDRLRRSVSLPSFTSEGWDKFDGNNNHQTYSHGGDPIAVLLQSYPVAARIPDGQGHMPLHLALAKGRRTWRTGVAAIVLAAPESVTARCSETELYPFQLAAMNESQCCSSNRSKCSCRENSLEVVETILELLLACPHVLTTSIDGGHRSNRKRRSQ